MGGGDWARVLGAWGSWTEIENFTINHVGEGRIPIDELTSSFLYRRGGDAAVFPPRKNRGGRIVRANTWVTLKE